MGKDFVKMLRTLGRPFKCIFFGSLFGLTMAIQFATVCCVKPFLLKSYPCENAVLFSAIYKESGCNKLINTSF